MSIDKQKLQSAKSKLHQSFEESQASHAISVE